VVLLVLLVLVLPLLLRLKRCSQNGTVSASKELSGRSITVSSVTSDIGD
jgi:hypothetical protein